MATPSQRLEQCPPLTTQTKFVRASTIAGNTHFTVETAREHIKRQDFGPRFWLWGEWCCLEENYLAWLKSGFEAGKEATK